MATAPSPNDLTRQQLDELDALLQRMLALPLDPPQSPLPPPAPAQSEAAPLPNWRVDAPTTVPGPGPRLYAAPLPPEPPRPRPPEPEPVPATRPPEVVAEQPPAAARQAAEPSTPAPQPAPPAPPPVVESKPAPVPTAPAAKPVRQAEPTGADSSVPFALWPLVALNWAADAALGLFGPPGRFLRSGVGKNLLGGLGVGLFLYTTAHVASEQGWIRLPVALPWPG